ncbi:MAG: PAS domain S-box protein [Candidatus Poribacteria bacterium]|nr:PAS domain S-box protein [Candidatus Poribacteria bacterium]
MSIDELKRENAELKAAKLELQGQIGLMQTIFDNLSEGVVASSLEGEFFLANPIAQEIAGMGPSEGEGHPEEWSEIYGTFYPDGTTPYPSTELPLVKAMRGEVTDNVKLFLRNQNRPEGIFINVSGRPLFNEVGDLIGGVVAIRDITDMEAIRDQLEITVNQLQTQNAVMDAIFNSIGDGIAVVDKDGKYVMFNDATKRMGAQDMENIYTTEASEKFGIFRPDSEDFFSPDELPLARALRGKHSDNIEMLIRNLQLPDGKDVSITARPIYDKNGAIDGAVSVIRDISELKSAQNQLTIINDELTAQSQLMQSIFNSISDGVVVSDRAGHIVMFNPSAKRIVGLPAKSSTNIIRREEWMRAYSFFYPDGETPWPTDNLPLTRALRGESTDNIEIFIKNDKMSDGIYLNSSSRPLQDSDGNKIGGVLVFHDITDRLKSQEAVAQAFVQGRLEIVDTILHNIGNAINSVTVGIETVHRLLADDLLINRLTALAEALKQHEDNLGDYLKKDPQGQKVLPFLLTLSEDFRVTDEELRLTVERIRDRTKHIVDIIRTQNSYQNTSGTRKDINLAATISDAIKMILDSIDKRQIQIEIDCDNAPEEIRIQESQFHQMLVNLIKNSIEAIDELVKLGEFTEDPRIEVRAYIDDEFLCIDITDNGIGIDPEDIDKVFSAGFTTKERGNGLGLHSSANFVISSGGKIQAFSDGKGKGATIHILLRCSTIRPTNHQE